MYTDNGARATLSKSGFPRYHLHNDTDTLPSTPPARPPPSCPRQCEDESYFDLRSYSNRSILATKRTRKIYMQTALRRGQPFVPEQQIREPNKQEISRSDPPSSQNRYQEDETS